MLLVITTVIIVILHCLLQGSHSVHIEYQVEVSQVLSSEELKTMPDKTAQLKNVADKEINEGNNFVYGILFVVYALSFLFCLL